MQSGAKVAPSIADIQSPSYRPERLDRDSVKGPVLNTEEEYEDALFEQCAKVLEEQDLV